MLDIHHGALCTTMSCSSTDSGYSTSPSPQPQIPRDIIVDEIVPTRGGHVPSPSNVTASRSTVDQKWVHAIHEVEIDRPYDEVLQIVRDETPQVKDS